MPAVRRSKVSKTKSSKAQNPKNAQSSGIDLSDDELSVENRPCHPPLQPDKEPRLYVGLDIGSSKCEAATAIETTKVNDVFCVDPQIAAYQRGKYTMPAKMGFERCLDDPQKVRFLFGHDVDDAVAQGRVGHNQYWENLKQCVYVMDSKHNSVVRMEKSLQNTQYQHEKALEELRKFERVMVVFPQGEIEEYYTQARLGTPSGDKILETTKDLFCVFLKYLHGSLRRNLATELSKSDEIMKDSFNSTMVKVAVPVPDIMVSSMVTRYKSLLIESGFHPSVEMVSESRCAAMQGIKAVLSQNKLLNLEEDSVDVHVCDSGHGTSDMSTVRIDALNRVVRHKFVVDSTGDSTGGRVVDDKWMEVIREMIEPYLNSIIPTESTDDLQALADDFFDGLRLGMRKAKEDFRNNDDFIGIEYRGKVRPKQKVDLPNGVRVSMLSVMLPRHTLQSAYDTYLEPLTRYIPEETEGERGLIQHHVNKLFYHRAHEGRKHVILFHGGAFQPQYVQENIRSGLQNIPRTEEMPAHFFRSNQGACIAKGAVLMLCDTESISRKFHDESIGVIVDKVTPESEYSRNRPVNKEVVEWLFMVGEPVEANRTVSHRYNISHGDSYIIALDNGEDPTSQDFRYPVDFEWKIARTENEEVGTAINPKANHPEIQVEPGIVVHMGRELCESIVWTKEAGTWQLEFDLEIRVRFINNIIEVDIEIPYGGKWDRASRSVTFTSLLGAKVSHAVHDHMYDEVVEEVKDSEDGEWRSDLDGSDGSEYID